jgi:hypothetical protein
MFEEFTKLPLSVRVALCALSGASIIGLVAMVDMSVLWIVILGMALVALALTLYAKWRKSREKKRAAALGGDLAANSSSAPQGVSDPARRAKLDDLRQNFQKGIEKFRAAGKDLYSLPWYMVVGEPGSGKTEAIRHCNVGFPPGLQDEMQGAGGTINMHWWFTNHAIMLDTAGKLLFSEAPPGTTTEWTEFLGLLRKHRTNCPINGLLLIIPADSLIKDSADELSRKAGKIAEQLDRIQRTLDVRFPVFVLVTKCDLINGFREFFAGLKDPQLQHQMMGWSNPEPLDVPFRPDLVDQHLEQVCQRVRRRRLGLLRDPVAETPNGRRTDEVDALFSLPHALAAIAPRLRRYLEMIFVAGEWSAKPLFLRGIFFTSALTEGKALDLEIAELMGVQPDALPEGKMWERERSFFLRDLFMQKIFKERGLVTRATNTREVLRRRQFVLFGTASVALAALLGFSVWGARSVERSVGRERAIWRAAAEGWQENSVWNPIVTPEFRGSTNFIYNGDNPVAVADEQLPLVDFHVRLRDLVSRDILVPLVFKPLEKLVVRANTGRRQAQRIVFDGSVTLPAVRAARARLENPREVWTPAHTQSLAVLLQLEGMIHQRGLLATPVEFTAEEFLGPLLAPSLQGAKLPEGLISVFDWTYYKEGDGRRRWPSVAWSAGQSFRENRPIASGWDSFTEFARSNVKTQQAAFGLSRAARDATLAFRKAEDDLLFWARSRFEVSGWRTEIEQRWAQLDARKSALDSVRTQISESGVFPAGRFQLATAYEGIVARAQQQTEAGLQAFRDVIAKFPTPLQLPGTAPSDFILLRETSTRLDRLETELLASARTTFTSEDIRELPELDKRFFLPVEDQPLYAWRWRFYRDALGLFNLAPGTERTLVGNLARALNSIAGDIGALNVRLDQYEAENRNEFVVASRNLLDAARQIRTAAFFELHASTVADFLRNEAGFPLIFDLPERPMNAASLKRADALLRAARQDLQLPDVPDAARDSFALTEQRVNRLLPVSDALVVGDGEPAPLRLGLVSFADQRKNLVERRLTADFGATFAGNLWRSLRIGGRAFRTQVGADTEIFRTTVAETLPDLEFFLGADPKPEADARYTFEPGWSALRLLRQDAFRRPGGREWEVVVRLKDDAGVDQLLLLWVALEKPLPEPENWPTVSSLRLR